METCHNMLSVMFIRFSGKNSEQYTVRGYFFCTRKNLLAEHSFIIGAELKKAGYLQRTAT